MFKILFQTFAPPYRSTLLCSNVVKFIWREIGEIVRYLPVTKKNKISAASQTVATARIAPKIYHGSNNVLTVLQISSKSVHFRLSNN